MQAGGEPGPSNPSAAENRNSDAVLNEVLVNQSALKQATIHGHATEDQDLVLAKMLQEQERAFLALAGGAVLAHGPAENVPPMPLNHRPSSTSPEEGRQLTDEELAWRLMQEEEAQFQQRMMALAGLGAPQEGEDAMEEGSEEDDEALDPDDLSYEELTALGEVVGTVATGLTAEQLAALPRCPYAAKAPSPGRPAACQEEEQCTVCRLEYEAGEEVLVLPCKHFYHPECIEQWLKQKKVCPQCNREVVESPGTTAAEAASGGAAR